MFWNCTRRPLGEDFARGWPDEAHDDDDGPMVLFESPDGAEAHAAWKLLRRNGYRMTWCPGPQGGFSPECALSATGHCPLVDEADAVVSALDLRDPRVRERGACPRCAGGADACRGRRAEAVGGPLGRGSP